MKRLFALFLSICMVITFVACGANNSNTKQKPQYGIQDDATFRIWDKIPDEEQSNIIGERNATDLDYEISERIQQIGQQMVNYINQTYDMNWAYEYVSIKMYDFTNTRFENHNAYYSVEEYTLYLNTNFQYDISGIDYIIAHELLHYIRHLNIGTTDFQYENTNGLGNYMMEALTDLFIVDAYGSTEEVETFFINNSAYCYQVTTLKILRMAIPNLMKYYLTNDMDALEKEFNMLSQKYVDFSGTEVENPFINYLDIIDASYVAYNAMVEAYLFGAYDYSAYYAEINQKYVLGQYELTLMLLNESDKKTKQKALDYIEYMYKTELNNEGISGNDAYEYYKDTLQFLEDVIK